MEPVRQDYYFADFTYTDNGNFIRFIKPMNIVHVEEELLRNELCGWELFFHTFVEEKKPYYGRKPVNVRRWRLIDAQTGLVGTPWKNSKKEAIDWFVRKVQKDQRCKNGFMFWVNRLIENDVLSPRYSGDNPKLAHFIPHSGF